MRLKSSILITIIAMLGYVSCSKNVETAGGEKKKDGAVDSGGPIAPEVKTAFTTMLSDVDLSPSYDNERYAKLTKQEYRFTVIDLLNGVDQETIKKALKVVDSFTDSPFNGHYNNLTDFSSFPGIEESHINLAEILAKSISESSSFKSKCGASDACFSYLTEKYIPRVWRRPLSDTEKQELKQFYESFPESERNSSMLVRIFLSVYFHSKVLNKSPAKEMIPYQIGSAISFAISGSIPDEKLFADMQNGRVDHPTVIREHINRLLAEKPDRFSRLFVPQWLGYSVSFDTVKDGKYKSVPLKDVILEPDLIFSQLIKDNSKIEDFFSLKFRVANDKLSALYNEDKESSKWEKVSVADSNLFGTAFMSYKFLDKDTDYPNPIIRGYYVVAKLLCRTVPQPTPDELALANEVISKAPKDVSPAGKMDFYRENVACKSCHDKFDFHGLAMEEIGVLGQKRDKYYTGHDIELPKKVEEMTFSSSEEFIEKLSGQTEFKSCFSGHLYDYFSGFSYLENQSDLMKSANIKLVQEMSIEQLIEDLAVHAFRRDSK